MTSDSQYLLFRTPSEKRTPSVTSETKRSSASEHSAHTPTSIASPKTQLVRYEPPCNVRCLSACLSEEIVQWEVTAYLFVFKR